MGPTDVDNPPRTAPRRSKAFKIGMPIALAVALVVATVAALSLRASSGELGANAWIKANLEYTVRDASGAIKDYKFIHNTTLAALKDAARDRLGVVDLSALTTAHLYDNIQALLSDKSGIPTANGDLSINLTSLNPVDGVNTAGGTGIYTVTNTFTASGASTIEELNLTRGAGTNGTFESTVGAWQNVSITLASGDTLAVTWTITVS